MISKGEIIIYQTEDNQTQIDVRFEDDSVWLTQSQMVHLFATSKQNISLHINNIFKEGELENNSVVKEYLTTAEDGKDYKTKYYNINGISSIVHREIVKILDPEFDIVLSQFGLTPSDYERMRVEGLAVKEI